MDINIKVRNKIAAAEEKVIICGNSDYIIRFDLDDEWAEYKTKTMRVDLLNGTHEEVIFDGDSCTLPAIHDRTRVAVGIYAGNIRTTTPAVLCCEKCITDANGVPAAPTEDVYSQLLQRLNDFDGYWLPEVSETGELSWKRESSGQAPETANIKGAKGDKGDKGDAGSAGAKGDKGDAGAAATVTVGTVTTGAAGSEASVTNSGTASAAVLDFVIPRGAKGDKGDAGSAADYIVQTGTTGKWSWEKWNSGKKVCWATFDTDALVTDKAWGSLYYNTWMNLAANKTARRYPFDFTETPAVIASAAPNGSSDYFLITDSGNNLGTDKTHAPAYAIARPSVGTVTTPKISYFVVGK